MNFKPGARQFALAGSLLWASSWTGCGGSSTPEPTASATNSGSTAPGGMPTPMAGPDTTSPAGEQPAVDAAPAGGGAPGMGMSVPDSSGSGSAPMGMAGMTGMSPPGMSTPGMTMPSMSSSGMGMPGMPGMGAPGMAMPGMSSPSMGMPGMGMPGMGMPGQTAEVDPAPGEGEDYLTKAKYAFAIGKESAAEQYFIAQIMASDGDAAELLQQIRWSPGARKPTTAVRFGVGIDLKAPTTLTDIRPVGRSQAAANNPSGGGSGSMMGMGMPGAAAAPTGGGKTFGDMTGKFGEELLTAFDAAWDTGSLSLAFQEVEAIAPKAAVPNNGMNGMAGMSGMTGMGGAMMSGGMPGGMPPGMNGGQTAVPAADGALRLNATAGTAIVPGLTYLGTGSQSELITKAENERIDFLFVFDVNVKVQRGAVYNDTRMRLVGVSDGASIGTTSQVNNLKFDRELSMKGENDDLVKQVANVFRKVETIQLTDLPKLEPVHAQARIKSLLAKEPKETLQILLETRLFHSLGLLDDEQRDAAFQLALPGTGLVFIAGPIEDREAVLDPLLPAYK